MKLHMIVDKSGVVVDIDTARRCSGIDVDDSNGTCLAMQRRVSAHGLAAIAVILKQGRRYKC